MTGTERAEYMVATFISLYASVCLLQALVLVKNKLQPKFSQHSMNDYNIDNKHYELYISMKDVMKIVVVR